jgi:hypothetical protein
MSRPSVIQCVHGLDTGTCSLCKPKPKKSRWEMAGEASSNPRSRNPHLQGGLPHGPRVPSKWTTLCRNCQEDVEEGDMVYLRDATWVCESCALEACRAGWCTEGGHE